MKKQFATYEIALMLKELGFNEPCFGYYRDDDKDTLSIQEVTNYDIEFSCYPHIDCLAPLWQQAVEWLFQKYGLHISLVPVSKDKWFFEIFKISDSVFDKIIGSPFYPLGAVITQELAYEVAILYAIDCIKKQ